MILVSVIIPTYNRAKLLKRAIESVLNQTFQDFELIVVDDGSTDDTKEIVKSFNNQKIIYIYQENFGGAAGPKNVGIKMAQGKYIAILDSDDEWLPEKLQKQVTLFERSKNEKLGVVGCDIYIIEGKNKRQYRMPRHKDIFKRILVTDDLGTGSTMIYKKEVFEKVGLFDENLKSGQDREMRLRLAQHYNFDFVDEFLVNYYYAQNGIASKGLNIEKREKDWQYIFEKYKNYYLADKKLYSDKLRYDGTRYMMLGFRQKAQKSFMASIVKNPLNLKSYLYLFLSLFGVFWYNIFAKIKLWLNQM